MDNGNDFVYFVNSQGKRAVISSPENRNYWELVGRSGFTAPEVDIFSEKYASGAVKYFGRALRPRTCSMKMVCVGDSTAERDKVFYDLVNVLMDPDGAGEGTLYVRRSDGSMAELHCVYSGGLNIVEQYRRLHLFNLTFYATDPWFYGTEKSYYVWQIYYYGNPLVIDAKPGMICRITYSGFTQPYQPRAGYIENTTTGKKVTYVDRSATVPNLPGYSNLVIDFNPRDPSMLLYTQDGKIHDGCIYFDLENTDMDFGLVPGQNTIDFSNLHYDTISYIYFRTRYRYLGV